MLLSLCSQMPIMRLRSVARAHQSPCKAYRGHNFTSGLLGNASRKQHSVSIQRRCASRHGSNTGPSKQHMGPPKQDVQIISEFLQGRDPLANDPSTDVAAIDPNHLQPLALNDTRLYYEGDEGAPDGIDTTYVEDDSLTRNEGYLSYLYGRDQNFEIMIKCSDEGLLDLHDIKLINHRNGSVYPPTRRGIIQRKLERFQAVPVDDTVSMDVLYDNYTEKNILQHLILVRVASEDPYRLDFNTTYCFDCELEELYRVSYMAIRDPATIEDPVLRFQTEFKVWILDSRTSAPSPMEVNIKHEANDLGVPFDIDLYSGFPEPKEEEEVVQYPTDDAGNLIEELLPENLEKAKRAARVAAGLPEEEEEEEEEEVDSDKLAKQLVATWPGAEEEGGTWVMNEDLQGNEGAQGSVRPIGDRTRGKEKAEEELQDSEDLQGFMRELDDGTGGMEKTKDDFPDVPPVDLA